VWGRELKRRLNVAARDGYFDVQQWWRAVSILDTTHCAAGIVQCAVNFANSRRRRRRRRPVGAALRSVVESFGRGRKNSRRPGGRAAGGGSLYRRAPTDAVAWSESARKHKRSPVAGAGDDGGNTRYARRL